MSKAIFHRVAVAILLAVAAPPAPADDGQLLRAGFGEADITPAVGKQHPPVYIAGFGKNRIATGVHDPLLARAVVLQHATKKIAIVSVDLVGLFLPRIEAVRHDLPGYDYVLVSSTHNHEGPDTLGLWGPGPFRSGVDANYLKRVHAGIVDAIKQAERGLVAVKTSLGAARAPHLVRDNREPYVKHDELVAIRFQDEAGKKNVGLVVQWNCHPETLDSKNTEISADFVAGTVAYLKGKHACPVVYLTGTVGGLMTSLGLEVKDDAGKPLADGTFAKTERYGRLVGKLADEALAAAKPVPLTPLRVRHRPIYLPLDNSLYVLGWKLGVLDRKAYVWKGDVARAEPLEKAKGQRLCMRTEIAWLRLGDLDIAAIPGEIYPELVLGKVQDPADPNADFPDAPIEPAIYDQLRGPHRMIIGLANDEIGYILPKRQWDEKAPFCYGRKRAQYGEVNSLGPDTAPLLCSAFRELVGPR